MGGGNPAPPGGGLPAANAGAAAAPQGPPGGAAANCNWEVYVQTHSQHRFWPGVSFDQQLCALNSPTLGAVAQTASVTMTAADSPVSKFAGSGSHTYGVTNTAPAIAKEADWVLVTGPTTNSKLPHQNIRIRVADGQAGPTAQNIHLYLRHPLLVNGQLRFKDPEDRQVNFPKGFVVAAYSGTGAVADTQVATAKLDVDGKFNFEIDRKWDWFTFKFGDTKRFISNGDATTDKTDLKPWSERKNLEKADAKFLSPPETWFLVESDWDFSEDPKYIDGKKSYKANEGKIYVFDPPTRNWVRRIGEKDAPVKMLLDPHWQFMRHEYFDRYYGHSDHSHEQVNMPSTLIEGFWGTDPTKLAREGSSHWTLEPTDTKKSVHCLPWIRQKDLQGAKAEKPDKDALIQFEMPASTFAVSSDASTRKYEHISASSNQLKASADRLKLYDMPVVWKSKGYWARYRTAPKTYDAKFWEDWDQPGMFKSRAKATPMIFSLDDLILTDAALVPLQTLAKTDEFSVFYHRFKKDYDEVANLTEEGVYKPDPVEPYYSKVERKGAKFNYISDYPNWVRMVAGLSACFDAFDQRTSQDVFGARAAVRWYDAVATATPAGTALAGQPGDIFKPADRKYFVIGPEWGQQHAGTTAPFSGSATPATRIGRFDMVLLRCCDRDPNNSKEIFLNLQYFRLNYNFLAAAPAGTSVGSAGSVHAGTDGKAFSKPAILALMQRWNGYDGAANPKRAELIPQKPKDLQGEVLYFIHPSAALAGAHFRMDVFKSGDGSDRAFMDGINGVGQITDTGFGVDPPANQFAPNSFTAAHEQGHGGSMPDEYGEWWTRCNHNGPGLTNNIPGDPYVDEGRDFDLTNSLYGPGQTVGPYPMMTMAVSMRNRYFWHNAEFARKHIGVPFYSKHDAYPEYKVPGHPQYPYRTYTYWPVRKSMNRKKGKHGAVDLYLHTLGKEEFTLARMPNGPWDGMVSILLKIDLGTIPATLVVQDVRDAIRNAIVAFNQQFSATGSSFVRTDAVLKDLVHFDKAVVRFSPRFLIANVNPLQTQFLFNPAPQTYAQDYTGWQGYIGTHFQITVVDNAGVVAPAVPVPSGWAAAKGGAMNLGVDSTKAWKAQLAADVQALLPDMLGIKVKGGVIAAKDLTALVGEVIHWKTKVS